MTAARKILIIGPSWVGDMVMAQSLFILLKQQSPEAQIDVLAPAWSRPLLARMPQVRKAIDMPVGHGSLMWSVRRQIARELKVEKYDQAILLPNSLKSALIPLFAGIPLRTGWKGEFRYGLVNDIRLLDETRYPLMVQRFDALALPPGATLPKTLPIPDLHADSARVPGLRRQFGLADERPVLALCPGAEFGPAKRWPEQYYAEVAAHQLARGWQVWLMGSEKDKAVGQGIIAALPDTLRQHCHNLAGVTKLEDAIDLLSVCDAVVSNDSGLMHISAALNRPLVVVYGSTSPGFTPPLNERVAILSIPVDCGPCFKRECPLGHMKCLNDLPAQMAITALEKLLSSEEIADKGQLS